MARAKRFDYAIGIDETGRMFAEGGAAIDPGREWTPEHLVLAALGRCTMSSLRYHAKRAGATVGGRVTASGEVTRRDEDGRFAFVQIRVGLEVAIEPEPPDLPALLMKAERDCFVGASLRVTPTYVWTVGGRPAAAAVAPAPAR